MRDFNYLVTYSLLSERIQLFSHVPIFEYAMLITFDPVTLAFTPQLYPTQYEYETVLSFEIFLTV